MGPNATGSEDNVLVGFKQDRSMFLRVYEHMEKKREKKEDKEVAAYVAVIWNMQI